MRKHKIIIRLIIICILLSGCSKSIKPEVSIPSVNPPVSSAEETEKKLDHPSDTANPKKNISGVSAQSQTEKSSVTPSTNNLKSLAAGENKKSSENIQSVPKDKLKEFKGFVLLSSLDKDLIIDLKYASSDNFTNKVIYPSKTCVLRKSTAEKLVKANTELKKSGYRIKVWDAYRPVYVQKIFWDIVKDSRFVANPKTGGSIHNKGCAVDVTLVDKNGREVEMPSKFDDFSSNAYRNSPKMSAEAKKNMQILTEAMIKNGFTTINTEWWHFDDENSKNYKIVDINLDLF